MTYQGICREAAQWGAPQAYSGGGSAGSSTTVSRNEPPPELKPFLTSLWGDTDRLRQAQRSFFPESTTVGFSPETEAALQGTAARASAGSPLVGQAGGVLSKTLSGDFLTNNNPYFGQVAEKTMNAITPRVNATFNDANRFGSGAHSLSLSSALADAVAPLAYQDYSRERGFQDQAMRFAPTLANQDYIDLAALGQVGAQREGQAQQELADAMARFQFPQEDPWDILNRASSIFTPGLSLGTQTSTSTQKAPRQSGLQTLLGLGLAGAGVAGGLGWSPFGAATPFATI